MRTPSKIHLEWNLLYVKSIVEGQAIAHGENLRLSKKVVKTGERFWISAEVLVESRQKYHSPRILMSTTLKLFGSGKGD